MSEKKMGNGKQYNDKLHVILDYFSRIANERNLEQLLTELADMGRDLIDADGCTLWLVDKKRGELWSRVSHGLKEIRIPLSHGIAGYVACTGKPEIINNPYEDERFDKEVDRKTGYLTKSIIALPINDSEGNIIGVFQAVNKLVQDGQFTPTDLEHFLVAATATGKSIESAMVQEEIERTLREIVHTLGEAGESRSKETGQHVKRVAEYSFLLAQLYGMDTKEAEMLKNASPLHDIGKIAIPDAILNKPARLDDEEREVMKSHTTLGYEILKGSEREMMKAAAIVAYEHHENWDGTGYPRGTSGEDIHLYGRITALADVFDALSQPRVYKEPWSMEKILSLFKEESGTHFEPALVTLFVDNFPRFLDIFNTYKD